nr:TlpA family protein disulfide reductase [uncultured Carboxylicivirga sp.]
MKVAFFIGFLFLFIVKQSFSQQIESINSEQLLASINNNSDTLYIVNFWATWCAPCVEELPIFNSEYFPKENQPLKIILVSLDFKTQIESKLKPFISNKSIQEKVVWLNESNPNNWVNKIDSNWSGAIPATKLYYKKDQIFHEGELTQSKLNNLIETLKQ